MPENRTLLVNPIPAREWWRSHLAVSIAQFSSSAKMNDLTFAEATHGKRLCGTLWGALSALLFLGLAGCFGAEADRMSDPVARAADNCRYVLERAIATKAELSPDGVLRRRIADFAAPVTSRSENLVRFTWPQGSIVDRRTASQHRGECVMDLSEGGQRVASAVLDGRPLHDNYRF